MSRQKCETNVHELLFTIGLASYSGLIPYVNTIETFNESLKECLKDINPNIIINNKNEYLKELERLRGKQLNNKFILNYFTHLYLCFGLEMRVVKIFLCGKTEIDEIKKWNKDLSHKERKGDIYAIDQNGMKYAFSIKQDNKCTKTNWSITDLLNDKTRNLQQIKQKFLEENGFPVFKKSERTKVNKLFHVDNIYWESVRKEIKNEINNKKIIEVYKSSFYGNSKLPYTLYEYDSKTLTNLSKIVIENITFEEHLPYYFMLNGKRRNTAKMFYRLVINSHIYRIEIRWKGTIYSPPQFLTHTES
jgi:hypothetical protein